jgi:hypothetical protein
MVTNATAEFYLLLNDSCRAVVQQATANPSALGIAQDRIDDLSRWLDILAAYPESVVLRHAINEVTIGLFLLNSGLYRPAFISLRLFLELSLATVHFSANRLELAEWLAGRRDLKWATLSDLEQGVLSIRYSDAFFPELRDTVRTYNTIALRIYRETSEFVHGNHHTWGIVTDKIAFNMDLHARWISHFVEASRIVVYALSLRFLKELKKDDLLKLIAVVNGCIGHIESVRDYMPALGEGNS